ELPVERGDVHVLDAEGDARVDRFDRVRPGGRRGACLRGDGQKRRCQSYKSRTRERTAWTHDRILSNGPPLRPGRVCGNRIRRPARARTLGRIPLVVAAASPDVAAKFGRGGGIRDATAEVSGYSVAREGSCREVAHAGDAGS